MIAFHGDVSIKASLHTELRAGRARGEFVSRGRGGIRSHLLSPDPVIAGLVQERREQTYGLYQDRLGIPAVLAAVYELLYEWLPRDANEDWPIQFAEAIPVGADLSLVWPRLAIWLLTDAAQGLARHAADGVRETISRVASLYQLTIDGARPPDRLWLDAHLAAGMRAEEAAAEAAHWAAESVRDAAAAAVHWAMPRHGLAAAAEAAKRAAWAGHHCDDHPYLTALRDKLRELLAAAPAAAAPDRPTVDLSTLC